MLLAIPWVLAITVKILFADAADVVIAGRIFPQVKTVQLESNTTFFCQVNNASAIKDLVWIVNPNTTSRIYTGQVNESVASVTIENVTAPSVEVSCGLVGIVTLHLDVISFKTGYPPERPHNISCVYFYRRHFTCTWVAGRNARIPTHFSLVGSMPGGNPVMCTTETNVCTFHNKDQLGLEYGIQVIAENELGKAASPVIPMNTYRLVKLDAPTGLCLKPIFTESPSFLLSWTRSALDPEELSIKCTIRYKQLHGSHWKYQDDLQMGKEKEMSYNLTGLEAYTNYTASVRCIGNDGQVFWSDWSEDVTGRTSEQAPSHSVELWRVMTSRNNVRMVHLLWKERSYVKPSGITQGYIVEWFPEDGASAAQNATTRGNEMVLKIPDTAYILSVVYYTSAGPSPKATLRIPASDEKTHSLIHDIKLSAANETVVATWNTTDRRAQTFVVEWCRDSDINPCSNISFQHVENSSEWTADKGMFEPYRRYRISVYPIAQGKVEAPITTSFYAKEGAPLRGPHAKVQKVKKTEVTIEWDPIGQEDTNGFLTSFSIIYRPHDGAESIVIVSSDVYEYTLQPLMPKTLYTAYITASTSAGNTSGDHIQFSTLAYDNEDLGSIIGTVGTIVILLGTTVVVYAYKKEKIKHYFWPDVPDPANSSIEWSSDWVQAALLVNPEKLDGELHPADVQALHTEYINEKALLIGDAGRKPSYVLVEDSERRPSTEDSSLLHYAVTEIRQELLDSIPRLYSDSCSSLSSCASLMSSLGDVDSVTQETPQTQEIEDILTAVNPYLKNSVSARETVHPS
ncbi:interleukin-31 receptor subunit alpha-like [Hyperolius riggenbachi]|uniref:interleukin-31 receptor subunit alpha-like n=1 Tax=Hyperolius riggenbachi TaxID=752182 RepID=UPI0035A267AB